MEVISRSDIGCSGMSSGENTRWTELMTQFNDATIYQTYAYGIVRWGEGNVMHHIFSRNGEVIALAQVVVKKLPYLRAGMAYVPWGPLWRRRGHSVNVDDLNYTIGQMREEYVKKRGLYLKLNPNIIEESDAVNIKFFAQNGYTPNDSDVHYRTMLVDLAPSLEELRKGLDQKWRNMLRQSERKNLEIVDGTGEDHYQIFIKLQREMQARKKYIPGVDYEEFGKIQAMLPTSQKMNIMICKSEGEPVAATIVSAIGDTGIYLLGATGDKGMKVKGAYLLQWHAIKMLKEKGCRWYDLGGINPEMNPGVYHFKTGLSGKDVKHIGQFVACENRLSSFAVRIGNIIRRK